MAAQAKPAARALHPPVRAPLWPGGPERPVRRAGEGYYAVGLARRCPQTPVVAFDIDPLRQLWCRKMAGANDIGGRLQIRGRCDPGELEHALNGEPSVVICDCEGREAEVIDPTRTPSLARAFLIIEVHDFVDERIAPALEGALAPTHELEWILAQPRWRDDFPELAEVRTPTT